MDIQNRRHIGFDRAQELQEFAATVPSVQMPDDGAGGGRTT
jgi:hypothetical protein